MKIKNLFAAVSLLLVSAFASAGVTYGNAVNLATRPESTTTSNTAYLQDNRLFLTPTTASSMLGVGTYSYTSFRGSGAGGFAASGHAIGSLSEIEFNAPGITTSTTFPLIGVEGTFNLIDGTVGKGVGVLGSLKTLTAGKTVTNYYGMMSHANSNTSGTLTNADAYSVDWSAFAGTVTNDFKQFHATNPGGTINGIVYGLYCDDLTGGAAAGCISSGVNAGTNRYGFYFTGTAQNGMMGNTYIGALTDGGGAEKLQVTGNAKVTGNLQVTGTFKPPVYTLATRPAASTAGAGAQIILSDVGVGGYSTWYSDGTLWHPVGGKLLLFKKTSTLATPLASAAAGATAGSLVPTGGNPVIPANLINSASGSVLVVCQFRRQGTGGTNTFNTRLGTAGTTADQQVEAAGGITGTNNNDVKMYGWAHFTSSSTYSVTGSGSINNMTSAAAADKTGNINTAAAMTVSFDYSAANVADNFLMWEYEIWLEQ